MGIISRPSSQILRPCYHHVDEVLECWQSITGTSVVVEANDTDIWRMIGAKEEARAEIDRREIHTAFAVGSRDGCWSYAAS